MGSNAKHAKYQDPEFLRGTDPRHFMVSPGPNGQGIMKLAAAVPYGDVIVTFPIPAPSALCLSVAHRAWLRSETVFQSQFFGMRDGCLQPHDPSVLFDALEDRLENIVFAFTAIEMFANLVLPEQYVFRSKTDRCTQEYTRDQVERWLPIERKLDEVLPQVRGVASPKGTALWQQFVRLDRFRDRVIHLKWDDVRKASPDRDTLWRELLASCRDNFSRTAHDVISHYCTEGNTSRWTAAFPYSPRRP